MSATVIFSPELKRNLKRMSDVNNKKTMGMLGSEVARKSHKYVPYLAGDLRKSVFLETKKSNVKIYYNEPYAAKLYEGVNFNFNTSGTQAKWNEPITNNKITMEKLTNKIVKKVLKI